MTLGFPTILIPSLSGDNPNETFTLGQEAISWIGSLNLICVPIGCLLSGVITQPLGRRRAMQFVNVPFLIAWLLFYFADRPWQVFLGLAIHGISGGLLEAPVLIYVAEITQPHLRGMLCSTSTLSVVSGTLLQFLFGSFCTWRTVALINCTVPLLAFILLFFVPETPHWLISKDQYLDARKSLAFLRGWTSLEVIEPEFKVLCTHLGKTGRGRANGIDNPAFEDPADSKTSSVADARSILMDDHSLSLKELVKLYYKRSFLWPFGLITMVFFIAQFNGTQSLTIFAVQIFATLDSPINKYYATIVLGVVNLAGCVLSVILVHYTGKRLLNLVSLLGAGVCFIVVATYAHLSGINHLLMAQSSDRNSTDLMEAFEGSNSNWLPLTFLLLAAFLTYTGIKILPWVLTGEIFPNEVRAPASGLTAASGYIFGFLATKTFLSMVKNFTLAGAFWTYGFISVLGSISLHFALPETEGKTLIEITDHFNGNCRMDNKVRRTRVDVNLGVNNNGFTSSEEFRGNSFIESRL